MATRRIAARALVPLLASLASGCVVWPHQVWIAPIVKGRAVNAATGQSVSGAVVQHVAFPRTAVKTDGRGRFVLPGVPERRWVVSESPGVIPCQIVVVHPKYQVAGRSFGILGGRMGTAPIRGVGVVPLVPLAGADVAPAPPGAAPAGLPTKPSPAKRRRREPPRNSKGP